MSQKALPTDLELTPNQKGLPRKEEKKLGKKLGHGTEKPLVPQNRCNTIPYKTFDRFTGPFFASQVYFDF